MSLKLRTQRIKSQVYEDKNGTSLDDFSVFGYPEMSRSLNMSFETGEQTTTRVYFPMKVTINKIRGIVMKALAATDAGTVTGGNSTGASTGGVLTMAASSALNYEPTAATPTTNNVVLADGYYYLTTAKSTAGGKVLVSLEYTVTA